MTKRYRGGSNGVGIGRTSLSLPRKAATVAAAGVLGTLALHGPAAAGPTIDAGTTVNASTLGSSDTPDFKGGTLKLNTSSAIANNFTIEDVTTGSNTIDIDGNTATLSGVLSGAGPLTFTDSASGGSVTISNSANTYTGITTIDTGATVSLSGTGTIATSAGLVDNGTLNISATTSGATVVALSGSGAVTLGNQTLTVAGGAGVFAGVISGTGALIGSDGDEILTGTNTYSGGTTVTSGTLQLGNNGTTGSILGNVVDNGTLAFSRSDDISFGGIISGSGGVTQFGTGTLTLTAINTYAGTTTIDTGTLALASGASIANSTVDVVSTFDISATSGAAIKSLLGTGTVQLGSQTLTLTAASGTFSGVIAGSGSLVLDGGTETLLGVDTYTGTTTVNAGTLQFGAATVSNNVTDNGTVGFASAGSVAMSGVISGSGNLLQAAGVTTISAVQTYTGTTTINSGTLALSGSGSIAASSDMVDNAVFSISAKSGGATITSLSGSGSVLLGAQSLTLSDASGTFSGVIGGAGGLTLDSGSETLSGSNTLTGVTTIAGGKLVLTNAQALFDSRVVNNGTLDISTLATSGIATISAIVSLSGSGTVVLGQNTLTLTGATDTFAGVISGTGGLTLSSGNEILTGNNTYTGTTTIDAGTLALVDAGSLANSDEVNDSAIFDISGVTSGPTVTITTLSGTGTVKLGAENLALANGSTIFFGAISGTGGLILNGGTEVLAGVNSYTGGTTIAAGTLQIGSGSIGGSIVGDVTDNGTLAFDRSDTSTFNGIISGTGGVIQMGTGTTILAKANSYAGGTTISAGTLQIGDGGTSGAILGDVTDNGTLAFGRSDTATFGATISGTGGVTALSGTTILTAIENYSGVTTIDSLAALTLTGTGSIAASSGIVDNGTLDLSGTTATPQIAAVSGTGLLNLGGQTLTLSSGSGSFSGVISGTGGLVINGGTTQALSGVNTYSGSTTVNGGTLSVNGSIAASSGVTVASGGTLAGAGTVPSVTLASGAAISPGSSGSGTLNVNGSVAFSSGSKFIVQVDSSSAGKLSTSGAEALAGALSVNSVDGSFPLGQKLTILTAAGGVSGTFSNTSAFTGVTGAEFSTTVSYDAHDAFLEIDLAKLAPLPAGATVNERDAAGGIDAAIAAGNTLPPAFQNLGTIAPAALQNDAGQLSGEVGADAAQAGSALFNPFLTAIFEHVADEQPTGSARGRFPQGDGAWVSGFIGTDILEGDTSTTGSHRMKANTTGLVLGGDWNYGPNILLGVAASEGASDFHLADTVGQGKVDGFQVGVYGLIQYSRHMYGSFAGAVALDNVKTSRTIDVSGSDTLEGKGDARMFGGRYETGVALGWGTPYVALQDVLFDASSYKETATAGSAAYALDYAGHTTNTADFELGIRQRGDINVDGWLLKLSDRLAWEHDMSATPSADAAFAALPDSTFTSYGARTGKNAMLFSLGADFGASPGFDMGVHFDSALTSRSQSYTETAELKYQW